MLFQLYYTAAVHRSKMQLTAIHTNKSCYAKPSMPTSSECIATFHGKMAKCSLKKGKTTKKKSHELKASAYFRVQKSISYFWCTHTAHRHYANRRQRRQKETMTPTLIFDCVPRKTLRIKSLLDGVESTGFPKRRGKKTFFWLIRKGKNGKTSWNWQKQKTLSAEFERKNDCAQFTYMVNIHNNKVILWLHGKYACHIRGVSQK